MVLGETNGWDAATALAVGLPACIAAVAGLLGYHTSRQNRRSMSRVEGEVTSPNGEKTATAIYEMRKRVEGLTVGMAELQAGQQVTHRRLAAVEKAQSDHLDLAERRFGRVFDRLGVDDPI